MKLHRITPDAVLERLKARARALPEPQRTNCLTVLHDVAIDLVWNPGYKLDILKDAHATVLDYECGEEV